MLAAEQRPPFGGAGEGARIGAGRERQHGDGAIDRIGMPRGVGDGAHFIRHDRAIVLLERIDAGDVPQQRRGMFERVALGEIDAIDAAIDRPDLGDGRNRRIHHRQVGIETAHAARLGRRRTPLLQRADVLRIRLEFDAQGAEAIKLYTSLLKSYPDYPRNDQVLYQLARAYETTGQPEAALARGRSESGWDAPS